MSEKIFKDIIYIPDNENIAKALERTTTLCIAAHQDDLEIMAYSHIKECYKSKEKWFTGIVLADGKNSPRIGKFKDFNDNRMSQERIKEQKRAAKIGKYSAVIMLSMGSDEIKGPSNEMLVKKLTEYINLCSPETILTHNLFDKHHTHVATAIKSIEAIRHSKADSKPSKVYSMEVWRGLDWLDDESKILFDTSKNKRLAFRLLSVFKSQISGGKRYDKAALARRLANATFYSSHDVDNLKSAIYAIDITDLIHEPYLDYKEFALKHLNVFKDDVMNTINEYE